MAKSNKIKFSISTLKEYLEDENSLVKCVNEKYHLAVKPWELGNLNESLKRIFNDEVGKFDKRWGGILLSTKNIKMLSDLGDISNDSPDIHINVEADFYVFKPQLDSILTGVVSKKSPQHLGVLVHQIFLVTIPKPVLEGAWKGNNRNIGDRVTFRINKLNLHDQLPYIRGQLEPSSSDEDDSGISTSEAECFVSKKKVKPNESSSMEEVVIKKKLLGLKKAKKQNDVVDATETSPTKQKNKKLKNSENINEGQDKKTKKNERTNKSFDDRSNLIDQEVRDVSPKKERNSIISEFVANAQNLLGVKNNIKKQPKNKNLSIAKETKKRKLNISDENSLDESLKLKKAKRPKLDVSENNNNESFMASTNLKEKYKTNKSVKNNENINKTPENKRKSLVKKKPSSETKDMVNKLSVTESVKNNENINKTPENKRKSLVKKKPSSETKDMVKKLSVTESVKNNENINKTPENKRKSLVKKKPSSETKDMVKKLSVTESVKNNENINKTPENKRKSLVKKKPSSETKDMVKKLSVTESVKNNENINKTPENKRKSLVKKKPSSETKDMVNKLSVTETEIEVTPHLHKINKSTNSLSERSMNSVGRKISVSFDRETEAESFNAGKKLKTNKSRRNTIIGIESEVNNTVKQKKKQNTNIKTADQSIIKKKIKYIDNLPNNSIFLTPDVTSTVKKLKKKRLSDIDMQLTMIDNIKAEKQSKL